MDECRICDESVEGTRCADVGGYLVCPCCVAEIVLQSFDVLEPGALTEAEQARADLAAIADKYAAQEAAA